MSFFEVLILSIVEGFTEFIPVSSTGHLIIFEYVLGRQDLDTFIVVIQLGAILAVLVKYFRYFTSLLTIDLVKKSDSDARRRWVNLMLAVFPALVMGALLYPWIKLLFHPLTVMLGLAIGGVFMLCVDRWYKGRVSKPESAGLTEVLEQMTYRQALTVGVAQCAALWPGMSRSASTIMGGVLAGLSYELAATFSFLVAVPVIVAAVLFELLMSYGDLIAQDYGALLLGMLLSFLFAYLSILTFLKLLIRYRLGPFAWYRIALASVLGILFIL